MSQPLRTIQNVIDIAHISLYSTVVFNTKQAAFNRGAMDEQWPLLLFSELNALEWQNQVNPSDPTLQGTANFVYGICQNNAAGLILNTSPCVPPTILIQPISQVLNTGDNVIFITLGSGTGTINYQWYFNGVVIGGATSSSYSITGVTTANNGSYYCIVSNNCGSMQTLTATLTVNVAAITGFGSYGDVDPDTALQAHTDPFTYQESYSITHNSPINAPILQAGSNNKFWIFKIPAGESAKTTWVNAFQSGNIPDAVFRASITFGGFTYYYTINASSFDFTVPLILS